jgi:peptidoglycan/xylan/chitin deacetylase (PgdA/CDA1 family)
LAKLQFRVRPIEPGYYSSLAEFRDLFAAGLPILTYHKVGPRPRGARLKGLYMGQKLFTRQLAELKAAVWNSLNLDDACPAGRIVAPTLHAPPLPRPNAPSTGRIVLTFDDGFRIVLEHALEPLREHKFQAIQFIVSDRIGQRNEWDISSGETPEPLMDPPQIREWLTAGHQIGSHTLTHPFLTRLTRERAREEIFSSKKTLEDKFGVAVRHFCYPYGDWNPAILELVAEAGYDTACTTEFGINNPTNSPLSLKRITARYQSLNWGTVKKWLLRGRS